MRILLATDAWEPQINGVVRTLTRTIAECRAMGHEVEVVEPGLFKTVPMPTYPEIKLALGVYEALQDRLTAEKASAKIEYQPGFSPPPACFSPRPRRPRRCISRPFPTRTRPR